MNRLILDQRYWALPMTIAREELKGMDFRDETTGQRLAAVHPGDVLLHDFIELMGLTRYKVAKLPLCLRGH